MSLLLGYHECIEEVTLNVQDNIQNTPLIEPNLIITSGSTLVQLVYC